MLSELEISRFRRDGFLHLKNVFGADEIAGFIAGGPKEADASDLYSLPALRSFWCDSRLVGIARQLLGESITYFDESSYLRQVFAPGERIRGRHLHHDAKGTMDHLFNRQHKPTEDPYPIIRFAVYLQDHANFSGGLKLVPGSHQIDSSHLDQESLSYFDVPSMPGDLVVFCNKILHSPYALRLKASPEVAIAPLLEVKLSAEQPDAFLSAPMERNVIFVDFAGRNTLADIYIKGRALNTSNTRTGLVQTLQSGPLAEDAERAGVDLRLDAGVVEAVSQILATADNGKMSPSGLPYLAALPRLCRMSKGWSPYFEFVPDTVPNESAETAVALFKQVEPRLRDLRATLKTVQKDFHMMAYELASVRADGAASSPL